jgi:2-polyprenyl-3-methyl-5-hydroxy-6-metoxy-1,4-benzoquinol methylase
VGWWTGWFTRRVASDGAQVAGLDRDAEALGFAGRHGIESTTYVYGEATAPPFVEAMQP